LFSVSGDDVVTALDDAAHIAPAKMIEKYGSLENVLWCGEGANAQRELIENAAESKKWRIASLIEERADGLAHYVSRLALQSFRQNQLVAPDALQAIYVRPSDAELKVS
jgi:tRNA A37 threonylcarbamoyladenosine modification protein TsaB